MAKKRTKAQRRAAALESWARRRAAAAMKEAPPKLSSMWVGGAATAPAAEPARIVISPPRTATVTQDGENFFLTVHQDGSMFRHRLEASTLRLLALDALRLVG